MKLHHIGKVVDNLVDEAEYYKEMFGFEPVGEPVLDPVQKVEVLLLEYEGQKAPAIELIVPVGDDSPVADFLSKGGGLHHLCFEVPDIRVAVEEARKKGALILGDVVPGRGHGDRETAWIYTRRKDLVELIQASRLSSLQEVADEEQV